MDSEKIQMSLRMKDKSLLQADLVLFEEAPDNADMIQLEINIEGEKISCKSENWFDGLLDMRTYLEKKGIQICCNGAARNVYHSPMQQSMGGTKAYKTYLGQQAKLANVVDIFEYEAELDFVSVEEQAKFHGDWMKSL